MLNSANRQDLSEQKNLTILVSDTFIGKKFTLKDGEIHKKSATTFSSGRALSVYAPDAETLRAVIETLGEGENLCLGIMPDHDEAKVVTDGTYSRIKDKTGTIARTTDHLVHPDGAGWLLIDFDDDWMPEAVADYVLVHELCHLIHFNHSNRFWQQVAQHCPNFQEAERFLKQEGAGLMWV